MLTRELKTLFYILMHPRRAAKNRLFEATLKLAIPCCLILSAPFYLHSFYVYIGSPAEKRNAFGYIITLSGPFITLISCKISAMILARLINGPKNLRIKLTKRERREKRLNPDMLVKTCFRIIIYEFILGSIISFPINALNLILSFAEKLPLYWLTYIFIVPLLIIRIIWLYHALYPVYIEDKTRAKKIIAKSYPLSILASVGAFLALIIAVFLVITLVSAIVSGFII